MSYTVRKRRKFPTISYKVCLRKYIYQAVLGNSNSELELTLELTVFFIRVGVELERSWSGILQFVDGVGAELKWGGVELEWSWS
jgi:hypothetical protein